MKLAWIMMAAMAMVSVVAFAQQRPNPAGFGSVLYPGTGGPPPAGTPYGGFGSVLFPGTGGPPGRNLFSRRPVGPVVPVSPHPVHSRAVIVPVPVYYGPYTYNDYAQEPAPYEDPSQFAAPAQAPVTIINPSYRADQLAPAPNREIAPVQTQQPQTYQPDAPATIYLIAMTNGTILSAVGYWVDGDTLNYITAEGDQNRVSLALVDREFSKKLNDDRQVEFKLPMR